MENNIAIKFTEHLCERLGTPNSKPKYGVMGIARIIDDILDVLDYEIVRKAKL
jgi:hypothetical protein